MKHILLSFILALISFGSFASNKICVGEKIIVVLNDNLKRLIILEKETLEIRQMVDLEGESFGELALSSNGMNIWFQIDDYMLCRNLESGENTQIIQEGTWGKFDLSAAKDHLVHYQRMDDEALIYVYDLNSEEAIAYAKVDSKLRLETAHYDHEKQLLHVLSLDYPSTTETKSKEPMFGLPETVEQLELHFRHDRMERNYIVYDLQNKKAIHDEVLTYSPDAPCNFEVINNELYIVANMGTAKVLEDFSLELTLITSLTLVDYEVIGSELVMIDGYEMQVHSLDSDKHKKLDDSKVNEILIDADALTMNDTHYYSIKEGIFYRFPRSEPLNSDFETSLE